MGSMMENRAIKWLKDKYPEVDGNKSSVLVGKDFLAQLLCEYAEHDKSCLKKELQNMITQFEGHKSDPMYQSHIEQNAIEVTLRRLKYLDSIAEYEEI